MRKSKYQMLLIVGTLVILDVVYYVLTFMFNCVMKNIGIRQQLLIFE